MKREVWLAANRRAILFGMLAPALLLLLGGGCLAAAQWGSWGLPGTIVGVLVSILGLLIFISLLIMYQMPRLAYEDAHLLVYLGTAQPYRIPIELVEVFFLGQAASGMPNALWQKDYGPSESATVVVRIAESAEQWQKRPVRPVFGQWCDGYVIVRGTWSEPITPDVVARMNQRLVECHRAVRGRSRQAAPDDESRTESAS